MIKTEEQIEAVIKSDNEAIDKLLIKLVSQHDRKNAAEILISYINDVFLDEEIEELKNGI